MENFNYFVYLIFLGGLLSLVLSRSHLLSMILSLEFLMLSGYLLVVNSVGYMLLDSLVLFLYLFVVVCEGCLGMGILISLVKGYGGEMFGLMSLLQC